MPDNQGWRAFATHRVTQDSEEMGAHFWIFGASAALASPSFVVFITVVFAYITAWLAYFYVREQVGSRHRDDDHQPPSTKGPR